MKFMRSKVSTYKKKLQQSEIQYKLNFKLNIQQVVALGAKIVYTL